MSAASNVNYWSSSEWSGAGYAFNVNFNNNGNLNFERNNDKSNAFRVRPVLAYRLDEERKKKRMNNEMMTATIPLADMIGAARRTLVGKRATVEAQEYEYAFYRNCVEQCREVNSRNYHTSRYIVFISTRPVVREIFGSHIRDRVIDTLIVSYILPCVEQVLVDDNYSTRVGKGTLYGVRRMEQMIRRVSCNYTCDCYILKNDIWSFFMSIEKQRAYQVWEQLFAEHYHEPNAPLLLYLLRVIIFDRPELHCVRKGRRSDWKPLPPHKSMFNSDGRHGLIIGKVISQLTALLILNIIDQFLIARCGVPDNGHYMDDRVTVHRSLERLRLLRTEMDEAHRSIGLMTHPHKTYLQHYSKGVLFAGAMILPGRSYVSRRTIANCFRRLEQFNQGAEQSPRYCHRHVREFCEVMNSYLGQMGHFAEWNTVHRLIGEIHPSWFGVMNVVARRGRYHVATCRPMYSSRLRLAVA